MQKDNYTHQTDALEELLQDDSFIASVIHPNPASEQRWKEAVRTGEVDACDYEWACRIVRAVQVKPETALPGEIMELWDAIQCENRNNTQKKARLFRRVVALAASMVAAVFLLLFFWNEQDAAVPVQGIETVKAPDVHGVNIQLVLADNQAISLEGEDAEIAYKNDGIEINSQTTELPKDQNRKQDEAAIIYNQLVVPQGKRSKLTLADGTQMWVNASTRVVYPVAFNGKMREIYVDGEVFLDVTHKEQCPFVVKTKTFVAEVLGTTFNVMAYENDTEKSLVLVSGSIRVRSDNKNEVRLVPNEMFTYANGSTQVEHVEVEDYISWISGIYQYESENLEVILKRLSRYYGIEISCDPAVTRLKCSGKLDLKDNLNEVLNGIALTAPVKCIFDDNQYRIINK